jgi:hypothetical protein
MLTGIAAVTSVWLWTPLAWPWYTVVGSLTTLAVGYVLSNTVVEERSSHVEST